MSIFKRASNQQFGLICFCTFQLYLIVIYIFHFQGYPIIEFAYCLPVIALQMLIQYLICWRPKEKCGDCFIILNIVTIFIMIPLFFGIYFGLFGKTMQYLLQDAHDCQVLGRFNTSVQQFNNEQESYSALYVNFTLDGEQYLGYGCLSSDNNDNSPGQNVYNYPYNFVFYGKSHCIDYVGCISPYQFNQVKLPSWMCLSFSIDYQELVSMNKCYVHFYNNESKGKSGPAYINARSRTNINDVTSFALITFSRVAVPYSQYLWLVLICFSPIFPAMSLIFYNLTWGVENYIVNITEQLKSNNL